MRHICRSESGRPQQIKSFEKLSGKPDLRDRGRSVSRRYVIIIRPGIFVSFHIQRSRNRCRNGTYRNNVVLFCGRTFHGLHHQRIKRHRQKPCSDDHSNNGVMCVPCNMGIYDICLFSHYTVIVFIVYIFVVNNGNGRDYIFYKQLQEDYILIYVMNYVMIRKNLPDRSVHNACI